MVCAIGGFESAGMGSLLIRNLKMAAKVRLCKSILIGTDGRAVLGGVGGTRRAGWVLQGWEYS